MRRFVVRKEGLGALLGAFDDTTFFNMEKEFEFDFRLVVKRDYFRVGRRFSFEDKWFCFLISKYCLRTNGHYTTSAGCEIIRKDEGENVLSIRFITTNHYLFNSNFITHFDRKIEKDISDHVLRSLPYLEEVEEGGPLS